MTFLTLLAEKAGHPLDMEKLDDKIIVSAIVESFRGEETALRSAIAGLL